MNKYILFISFGLQFLAIAQPQKVVAGYIDAILSGDWKKAEQFWVPEDIQCSQRLGIAYSGIDAKYDCASPLVLSVKEIRLGRVTIIQGKIVNHEKYIQIPVRFATERETVQTTYHLINRNDSWFITSPLFLLTKEWRTIETKFAVVHYSDEHRINSNALNELDNDIDLLCKEFQLPKSAVQQLQKEKLHYYLGDDETVKNITGYPTKGIANLQFDAVVSSYLPHYHEITHFVVNYILKEIPLYTIPWLQEGTAVAFGGRWGKSSGVILQMGNFLFDQQMFTVDDLLTYHGFHSTIGSADFSYPLSGLFAQFLLERYGPEKFLLLYRSLSGSSEMIRNLSVESIQSIIAKSAGTSWQQLSEDFHVFRKQYTFAGIIPGTTARKKPVQRIISGNCSIQISETDSAYLFDIRLDSSHTDGSLLFTPVANSISPMYKSFLFAEHFHGERYRGEKYSLRFSNDEAGLYDYHTNVLIAKYVLSFSPGTDYRNNNDGTLHFMLQKKAILKKLSDYTLILRIK